MRNGPTDEKCVLQRTALGVEMLLDHIRHGGSSGWEGLLKAAERKPITEEQKYGSVLLQYWFYIVFRDLPGAGNSKTKYLIIDRAVSEENKPRITKRGSLLLSTPAHEEIRKVIKRKAVEQLGIGRLFPKATLIHEGYAYSHRFSADFKQPILYLGPVCKVVIKYGASRELRGAHLNDKNIHPLTKDQLCMDLRTKRLLMPDAPIDRQVVYRELDCAACIEKCRAYAADAKAQKRDFGYRAV